MNELDELKKQIEKLRNDMISLQKSYPEANSFVGAEMAYDHVLDLIKYAKENQS